MLVRLLFIGLIHLLPEGGELFSEVLLLPLVFLWPHLLQEMNASGTLGFSNGSAGPEIGGILWGDLNDVFFDVPCGSGIGFQEFNVLQEWLRAPVVGNLKEKNL